MVNSLPFAGKVISVTGASRSLVLAPIEYLLIRGAMRAISADNLSKAAKEVDDELPGAKIVIRHASQTPPIWIVFVSG